MDNEVKEKAGGIRRVVMTCTPSDMEAHLLYSELDAAAKLDRRELGEFLLVKLLDFRAGRIKEWFGLSTQGNLETQAGA